MTNNQEELCKKLEKLNAQIDIWIDDEDYGSLHDHATGIKPNNGELPNHDQTVEFYINTCFPEINKDQKEQEEYCTHYKDDYWRQALNYDIDSLPVVKVGGEDLKPPDKYWSHLFYAKLFRAKIKQKGNDCYTRRLDDIAAYLERHFPQQSGDNEWETRLALIYLMELSAVSMDWESLGYSERARREITNAKHSPRVSTAVKKAPYEFYELWAGFNIGVAYFHRAYYRKAVQEFNQIIRQVNRWKSNKPNMNFYEDNHGRALLYIPAIFSRSEVQLKLQFAYHTIKTLQSCGTPSKQKKPRAKIIKAQAYQQLGRLDRSWLFLCGAYSQLSGKKRLGKRTEFIIPNRDELNKLFPSLGERFIDILIADSLGWLKLEGGDERKNQKDDLELRYIVKYGNTNNGKPATAENYKEAVGKASSYLNNLIKIFAIYYDLVKHNVHNRSGYFQQLARYLAWLVKAADFKYSDPDFAHGREKITKIAFELYETAKNNGLLLNEDKQEPESGCRYCDAKGINLEGLDTDHYTWFTEDILEFFNSKAVKDVLGGETIKGETIKKDKEDFVKRLLKLEQINREDLRIHDLKLRYEYYGKEELLEELCGERQSIFDYAREQCWGKLKNQAESLDLLECNRKTITKRKGDKEDTSYIDRLKTGDYIKIMQDWDKDYLRQLRSPSTHENQKDGFYFMGLQRWNSASPAKGFSVGGGYLLYHLNKDRKEVDMGIAIDPGFDFVRNLFHMGFSLDDIDIVLISHAHLDHIRDFESIIILLSELEKRGKREKRVHVILSLGAYRRLKHVVDDPRLRYFLEPYIIDVDREISDDYFENEMPEFRFEPATDNKKLENSKRAANDGRKGDSNPIERFRAVLPPRQDPTPASNLWAKITPTRAYHDDKTNYSDSFGFKIELNERNQDNLTFGYTGDTMWVYPNMPDPLKREDKHEERKFEDIAKQYEKCDVLLVHLGSLVGKNSNNELSFTQYDQCGVNVGKYGCEKLVRENHHPYLIGMLRLLSSYYNCVSKIKHTGEPLVLVSEFGEELRGTIRSDFLRRLREVYKQKMAFLPVDVGLNVQMGKKYGVPSNSRSNRCACKVWCVQCNRFVNIGDAEFELYGTDHALYCVCKTCRKATPINVLQDKLRQLYEVGLELRTE
jgi:ribonuclease BN (tRNA processing enzyme)